MRRAVLVALAALAAFACTPDPGLPSPQPTSPPTVSEAPGTSPSASFVRPTPNPSPTFLVYEVKAGDSLTSIAREFGTTARSIAYWNREAYPSLDPDSAAYDPDRITVGWVLRIIPTAVFDEEELLDATSTPEESPPPSEPGPPPT